jgi:mono/diheme cytochrome c family protein
MRRLLGIGAGLLVALILATGVFGVAVVTGVFDLSATAKPSALEQRIARFLLNRSIERRAPRSTNPIPSSAAVLEEGLSHYRTNCLACHGAPGVEPFELGRGLNPPAPDLSAPAIQARPDGELFWVIRHGIRMTGMPAFQPTHSDEEIWALVGTVRHLPQLMPAERAFLQSAHETQEHRHDDAGHEHAPSPGTTEPNAHSHETAPEAPPSPAVTEPHVHSPETTHEPVTPPASTDHHAHSPASGDEPASTESEAVHDSPAGEQHQHEAEPPPISMESRSGTPNSETHSHQPDSSAVSPLHPAEDHHPHGEPDSTGTEHRDAGSGAQGHEHESRAEPEMRPDHGHASQEHAAEGEDHLERISGLYGSYLNSRESSGTAWQPERAPHDGLHVMRGAWMYMFHGFANAVYDDQGGKRGDEDVFGASMLMGIARRPVGSGVLGLRAMLSGDPATIGKEGYPLLLQTGETANGRDALIDRQHPHDLWMELAASLSVIASDRSAFLYLGMPGEPALGPPAFMHRHSGLPAPLAPISHHWLDSTHITFGVATLGLVQGPLKLEASLFTGREPDEERWGWDTPKMDSHAFRVSYNPGPAWSLQTSFGRLQSSEQLHPDVDTDRTTASVMYNPSPNSQITLAWGRNENRPGRSLDMFLAETAIGIGKKHTLFARAEYGQKNELFTEHDPRADRAFTVAQTSVGYIHDVVVLDHALVGIGGSASISFVPKEIEVVYGRAPLSGTIFARGNLK